MILIQGREKISKKLESVKKSVDGLNSDININKSELAGVGAAASGFWDELSMNKYELVSPNNSI